MSASKKTKVESIEPLDIKGSNMFGTFDSVEALVSIAMAKQLRNLFRRCLELLIIKLIPKRRYKNGNINP